MTISELITQNKTTAFSFEVLPPLKGTGIDGLKKTIDRLADFNPQYINITNHRSEYADATLTIAPTTRYRGRGSCHSE